MDGIRLPIPPMLARAARPLNKPFDSDKHIFELKWDGTRCIAFVDKNKGSVTLHNRRLREITYRYPELEGLKDIRARSAALDGEMVVLHNGRPDFGRLQQREHLIDPAKIKLTSEVLPATYILFDLLYLDGKSLLKMPLVERRGLLRSLFPISDAVVFSESYESGTRLFREALKKGFEGIMAKEKDSPYLPGERSGYWLKIKKAFDVDAVVCGFTEGYGGRSRQFGSLILGLYDGGKLRYIGRVGTGLDDRTLGEMLKRLEKIKTAKSPFKDFPHIKRRVYWVRPEIVVRAGYHEWTKDGSMRFPIFKGIREDKAPKECGITDAF